VTFVATARTAPAAEGAVADAVAAAFPNVTAIPVRDVLERVGAVLGDIAVAIRVMALFTVATGVVVMAGALTATRYQRLYESVVLRTLGATRGAVARAFAVEYGCLGAAAGLGGHRPRGGARLDRAAFSCSTRRAVAAAGAPGGRPRQRGARRRRRLPRDLRLLGEKPLRCCAVSDRPKFQPLGLDHVVLRVADQAASRKFYEDVLGCTLEFVNEPSGSSSSASARRSSTSCPPRASAGARPGRGPHLSLDQGRRPRGRRRRPALARRRRGWRGQGPPGRVGVGPSLYIRDLDGYQIELKPR